jgi:Mg-chelatase subunit ChlD
MADMVKAAGERYGAKELEASRESFAHLLPMARNTVQRMPNARGYWNANAVRVLQEPLKSTSVLHGQLARLLVSDEKSARTHFETSGRLDRRALVRMRTGAPDVFSQRQDAPAVQTALIVLVDESGSMAGLAHVDHAAGIATSRMELARCTAWAIARAAEDAGAKVSVIGFTSLPHAMPHVGAVLHVAKDFDEPCATAAASIARMAADQTTPMSPAIVECAGILSSVPATRRIVMVITDGACNYKAPTVRAACVIAADADVEVVGVGMACGSVIADAFPDGYSVTVDNLDQLATTGLGTLVRMLEERE